MHWKSHYSKTFKWNLSPLITACCTRSYPQVHYAVKMDDIRLIKKHPIPSYYCTSVCVAIIIRIVNFNCKTRLTFWGQSQRLLCCTCGSSHQIIWWQCSLTSWQSWRCKLCKASPLGSGFVLAGNPVSGPRPIPASHTLSCCPPASADRLPYLGAGKRHRKRFCNPILCCSGVVYVLIFYLWIFFVYFSL